MEKLAVEELRREAGNKRLEWERHRLSLPAVGAGHISFDVLVDPVLVLLMLLVIYNRFPSFVNEIWILFSLF